MKNSAGNSRFNRRPTLAGGAHGRLYILATVTLAVFLIVVVLWRKPADRYTSSIAVQQVGSHPQWNDRDSIVSAILAIHLEHDHGPDSDHDHSHAHSPGDHHGHPHQNGGHRQPHLLVDVVDDAAGAKQISIWCSGKSERAALEEARFLGETYVARVNRPPAPVEISPARKASELAVQRAEQEVQRLEAELRTFRETHEGSLADNSPPETNDDLQLNLPVTPAVHTPEPELTELKERLQVLQAARDQLLEMRTAEHPEVRDLQWQVEKLQAELAVAQGPVVEDTAASSASDVTEDPQRAELRAQRDRLQAQLEEARHYRDRAAQELASTNTQRPPVSTAIASITSDAQVVSRHGAGATMEGVVGGLGLGLLFGLVVAGIAVRVRKPAELVSLQTVEALGIPVVASLTTGDGPALPAPQASNPRWIRWLIFGCELLIAAVALLMLFSALADWQFAAHLVRDPLGALAEAANRLT